MTTTENKPSGDPSVIEADESTAEKDRSKLGLKVVSIVGAVALAGGIAYVSLSGGESEPTDPYIVAQEIAEEYEEKIANAETPEEAQALTEEFMNKLAEVEDPTGGSQTRLGGATETRSNDLETETGASRDDLVDVEGEGSSGSEVTTPTVNGIELPTDLLILKETDDVSGALMQTTSQIVESGLINNDVSFVEQTLFIEEYNGQRELIYERFSNLEGREDFDIVPTIGGEQPQDIQDAVPSGIKSLSNGDMLIGFNMQIINNSGEIEDSQWVLARYSQIGANEHLGWGLASINIVDQ